MDPTFHQPDEMAGYLGFLMHRRRVESRGFLLQHFGFQEDPFRVSPDARYLFPSQTHLEALASLENGFYNNRGFIAMIAPPGMGKTTLLYRFLEDTRETARSVFLFDIDADCEPRDFVGYILRDLGITPAKSSSEMHKQLGDALIAETQEGRKCVVVIDEAQNLSDAVLERVRLLTNFETSQGKLLQIILSGQPQLTDKLLQASLVQLRQRVSTVCRLELLTAEETVAYIDYRLRQAGYDGEPLFTEDALKLIAEAGQGTPRTINNLCYNSLALCSEKKSKQVDAEMVAKVAANLQLVSQSGEPIAASGGVSAELPAERRRWDRVHRMLTLWGELAADHVKLWVPATVAVLILCVLGVLRLSGVGSSQGPTSAEERPLNLKAATESFSAPAPAKAPKTIATRPIPTAKPSQPRSAVVNHASTSPKTSAAVKSPSAPANALTPPLASLNISSTPPGADIEIDGAFVGNTPSTISIAPGIHRISTRKKGFADWSRSLNVTGGAIHLNAELEQEPPKQ
jgi:general secretion pathway protein A